MPSIILSETTASVSELKSNPMATVSAGEGFPVAILNRNKPAFLLHSRRVIRAHTRCA
ncbi:Uncharacterised protein [Pluralibacter gergoviae]|nr:Uncharacterised protein [Pluralibacter gergoviae]